jgi:hypothetical protein
MADVQVTAVDTTVRLCGSGKLYRLTGPALDTIAERYRYANTRKGQWMKLWFSGHLGVMHYRDHMDSAIIAVAYQHLDASLHCDPVPDLRMGGRYRMAQADPYHPRAVDLDLFDDGSALMYTDLYDGHGPLEEDGRWGADADGQVNVSWPQRDQTMVFHWRNGALESTNQVAGRSLHMERVGASDASSGSLGRVARWLAAVGRQHGRTIDPALIRPSAALRSVLVTDAALEALRLSAKDTLQLDSMAMKNQWAYVVTVKDAMRLMRRRMHGV